MVIISRISKGSKMDQIYIPKNRAGLGVGSYVLISPASGKQVREIGVYYYGVRGIEPIKVRIIKEIFSEVERLIHNWNNLIITGSFVEEGFGFRDVDLLIVSDEKINTKIVEGAVSENLGVNAHILLVSEKMLAAGLKSDPFYLLILSKCIARRRFVYNIKRELNYKILDLHLLKSRNLSENFDSLSGKDKYNMVRNAVAIWLFLKNEKIGVEEVNKEIRRIFELKSVEEIKLNILGKTDFLKKYKRFYNNVFEKIMKGVKNGAKSK